VAGQITINEPLEPWVEKVIDRALLLHEKRCWDSGPGSVVRRVELRWAYLAGCLAGSGIIGGGVGAAITLFLGGK
jgi:hypothetical protein